MNAQDQKPLDMNEAFRGIAQEVVNQSAVGMMVNTLITAGNALRGQAYNMLGGVDAAQFVTKPALLSDGSSMALVPFFRPLPGFFRLVVAHAADGARVFTAFLDEETNTLQSRFLELNAEKTAELERQLAVVGMENKGWAVLGLVYIEKPVEGYEYFTPVVEAAPEVANEAAPVVAEEAKAPVALDSVIADAAV